MFDKILTTKDVAILIKIFFVFTKIRCRRNHREDKFLRATNYKHYASESKANGKVNKTAKPKTNKKVKALSFVVALPLIAVCLIVPTTTLAPDVDAFEDSRAASYSVGDIDEFSAVITNNCVEVTTAPLTQEVTTVAETTKAVEATEAEITEATEPLTVKETVKETSEAVNVEYTEEVIEKTEVSTDSIVKAEGYLIGISNPDPNYSPKKVTLSSYDRAKLERLVMGEAGSMGYNGCALVAQAIRDAMNRSNTSSIDRIISEYQYYAPTNREPNQTVKDAVSYIFDQNGSAVQHRVLCFYTGTSAWHETQTFVVGCGNVRFFDFKY